MIRPAFFLSRTASSLRLACVASARPTANLPPGKCDPAARRRQILQERFRFFLYLDDDTIRGWHKTFLQDGWDALAFDGAGKGGQSRNDAATGGLRCAACWKRRFCRSTVEIRAPCSQAGVRSELLPFWLPSKLLARLGFEYLQPQAPAHARGNQPGKTGPLSSHF